MPLLLVLRGREEGGRAPSLSQSALLGYLCGVTWFAGNCYWIYQTMFLYGGMPSPAALGILILFALYLGLYFALFGWAFAALRRWKGPQFALAATPVLWIAGELARSRVTGFPWDLLGYTQVDSSTLIRLVPWTGVMGLSFLVALGNALWLWRPRWAGPARRWLGPAAALTLAVVCDAGLVPPPAPVRPSAVATMMQDNLSVGAEAHGRTEGQPEMLADFSARTLHPQGIGAQPGSPLSAPSVVQPQLVVWPEAPTPFTSADPQFRAAMAAVARQTQAPVIVDGVGVAEKLNAEGRYDESPAASFFLADGSYAGRYDKMHLVPFGEYTPYKQLFFFTGHLLDQLAFVPGTQRRLFTAGGRQYGVFICYESIFGDEVREFAGMGAQVLVNVSDDGWYGDTSAPWEHLDMARMRAAESRRWLLRDTNTGLTASIDPYGRVVASMPRHVRLAAQMPFGYRNDVTFYVLHGDWVGWLCAGAAVALLMGYWFAQQRAQQVRAVRPAGEAAAQHVN